MTKNFAELLSKPRVRVLVHVIMIVALWFVDVGGARSI